MLKRLPLLCAALLALAACSHDSDNGSASQPPVAATSASAPASTASAATHDATVSNTTAPASSTAAGMDADTASAAPVAPAPAAKPFVDDGKWIEGKQYQRIEPAQPKVTNTSKIEVVEVFSYGCPACNQFHATANKLARELPADAQMAYLPASFVPQENWPMLQRAYFAAQAMGVAAKGNDAMYDAVWKTHELTAMKDSGGLKSKEALPTLADAAKVYAKFGADPKEFVAVANSFAINTKVRRADELVKAYGVEGTPSIVVNGKYRLSPSQVGADESVALTKWLVAKEAAGK
ncbi:MAG: thiol:disulfide interchange protein DsbA/DsbL [Rhodanobacter sp.]